jgi:hypothetical protein
LVDAQPASLPSTPGNQRLACGHSDGAEAVTIAKVDMFSDAIEIENGPGRMQWLPLRSLYADDQAASIVCKYSAFSASC